MREARPALPIFLQAQMTKPHHVIAMNLVLLLQIILEDKEIRQGNSEIVDLHVVVEMTFSIIFQFVEATPGLIHIVKFLPCESLVEDHIGRLVVVKYCACGFFISLRRYTKMFCCLCGISELLIGTSQIVVNMICVCSS